MEQLDKNQSYFFLFDKDGYTMEQVRTFTLEECYQHSSNDDIIFDRKEYDSSYAEEIFNLYFTGEDAGDDPWCGDGLFLHARIASGENYVFYELLNAYEDSVSYKDEDYEVHLDDGRVCLIRNDCSLEWGGIEFEDETTIQFDNIPTELLDELVQKTPLVVKVTLEQFEQDWYLQKEGRFVAIRIV